MPQRVRAAVERPAMPVKPRRFKKAVTPARPPEPSKCAQCGYELTWRDRFYAPSAVGAAATVCKTCQQRGRRKRLGVVAFHPATVLVKKSEKPIEVPVRFNRAARRKPTAAPASVSHERKPTRAERRAKARAATAVA